MKKTICLAVVALFASMAVFAQELEQQPAVSQPAQTQELKSDEMPIDFYLTFINAGATLQIPLGVEGFMELINIGIEGPKTGLGVSFSPFYLYGLIGARSKSRATNTFNTSNNSNNYVEGYTDEYGIYHEPVGIPNYDYSPYEKPDNGKRLAAAGAFGTSFINVTASWNFAKFLFPSREGLDLGIFGEFHWLYVSSWIEGGIAPEKFRIKAGLKFGKNRGDKIKYNSFTVEMGYLLDSNCVVLLASDGLSIQPNDHKFFVGIKGGR